MTARPESGAENETGGLPAARRNIRCAEGPASRWQALPVAATSADSGIRRERRRLAESKISIGESSILRPVRIKSGFFFCAGRRGAFRVCHVRRIVWRL